MDIEHRLFFLKPSNRSVTFMKTVDFFSFLTKYLKNANDSKLISLA